MEKMTLPAEKLDSRMTSRELMKRATFVRMNETVILKFDLSNLDDVSEVRRVVAYFRFLVRRLNRKAMVGLIDFTSLTVGDEVVEDLIHLTGYSNPFFRASAVVANNREGNSLVDALIAHFGKLNFHVFKDESAARECLSTL